MERKSDLDCSSRQSPQEAMDLTPLSPSSCHVCAVRYPDSEKCSFLVALEAVTLKGDAQLAGAPLPGWVL